MKFRFYSACAGLLALLLFTQGARAQAPVWQTAVAAIQTTGAYSSSVQAVAADSSGNVYIVGDFSGIVTLGNVTLTTVGEHDIFVAKWSRASSSFLWAQQAGGASNDQPGGIAVEGDNVFITGGLPNGGTVGSSTFPAAASFIAKLRADSGMFVWAQGVSGSTTMSGASFQALAVHGSNLYVAGSLLGTAGFGPFSVTSAAAEDVFVAKLTDAGASGSFAWVQRAGGASRDGATALAVNRPSVYVAGYCRSLAAGFGNVAPTGTGHTFVAKLTDAGPSADFIWMLRGGSTGSPTTGGFENQATALAVSGTSLYATGIFNTATAVLGADTLTNAGTPGVSTFDGFVAKLSDLGASSRFVWAQQIGGRGTDITSAVAVQGAEVYVSGSFASDTLRLGTTIINDFNNDVFVAKLADTGADSHFVWARQAGGGYSDQANSVAITPDGTVYVGGGVAPPARFGSYTLVGPVSYQQIGFLASLQERPLARQPATRLSGVRLYPNPAQTVATVFVPAEPGAGPACLVLTNALGRVVRARTLSGAGGGQWHELDVRGLAPGLYSVRVQVGRAYSVQQLVVN